jgi:hypothetical protein
MSVTRRSPDIALSNPCGLAEGEIDSIGVQVTKLRTLDEVVKLAHRSAPPRTVIDVVVQDEYSHDVVLAWSERLYLVFGTT